MFTDVALSLQQGKWVSPHPITNWFHSIIHNVCHSGGPVEALSRSIIMLHMDRNWCIWRFNGIELMHRYALSMHQRGWNVAAVVCCAGRVWYPHHNISLFTLAEKHMHFGLSKSIIIAVYRNIMILCLSHSALLARLCKYHAVLLARTTKTQHGPSSVV